MKYPSLSVLNRWLLFACLLFGQSMATSAQVTMIQTPKASTYVNAYINGYYEALPSDYAANPTKKYPLLVFIHGLGEIGNGSPSQLPKVLVNGPPKLINNKTFPATITVNNENFSFIVISPQFNANNRNASTVESLIDYIVAHYRVDPSRIYLTGLSMGGGDAWIYAGQTRAEADRLAALVVVSGATSPYPNLVGNIANSSLPVWAFHNQNDPTVPSSYTTGWIANINGHAPAPTPAARGTIFPVSGHDAWTKAYDPTYRENGMNVYEWMLQFSRNTSAATATNKAPIANAGADKAITLPTSSVTLTGSGTDADGSISSYTWSQVSGPSTGTISSSSSASTTISNLVQGTYIFRLTVKDNGGLTATDDVSVIVNPAPVVNKAPTANAGADQTITLPASGVTLNGSGADSDGTIASYAWAKLSGPTQFAIATPNSATTAVSNLVQGTYVFQLTVQDNGGLTATANVTITVNPAPVVNKAPTANAGTDQTITLPTSSVTLSGSGKDTDGTITAYSWTKINGPATFTIGNAAAASTTVSNLVQGTYQFELKVTDNSGSSTRDSISVKVNPAPVASNPGDCGCSITLPRQPDGGIYVDAGKLGVKPGDVVCIAKGTYPYINIWGLNGTKENPIIVKNCGGQVLVVGKSYGIAISKNKHFKFTGTGDPNYKYGFLVDAKSTGMTISSGFACSDQSEDFTINNVEIANIGGAGVICKTNPTCDPMTWGGNFVMRDVTFHDVYVHNVKGEGFYVGYTFPTKVITCSGKDTTVETQTIENLNIYNCKTDTTGWDGIQVSHVPVACNVYNNEVLNYGVENHSSQQAGLLFGGGCNGKVYNNLVKKGTGCGLQILGIGNINAYNNIIIDCGHDGTTAGQDGVYVDDRPITGYQALSVNVSHNTIISPGRSGVRVENTNRSMIYYNEFHNNLIIAPGSTSATDAYISIRNGALSHASGNLTMSKFSDNVVVDTTISNYRLQALSPAINVGIDISQWGISTDKDGNSRVADGKPDAGAYEYASVPAPPNQAPKANAGVDTTITLPINSVGLTGSGTDADGSISSYAWSQVSGPSASTISGASSASATVSSLVQGNYVFRLTVKDNGGLTATDDVTVTVNPAPNKAPTANAGVNQSITLPTNTVNLSGSGVDTDGTIVSYAWTKLSGPAQFTITTATTASTSISNLVQGTYVFQLTVKDNGGLTASANVTITVNPAPVPNKVPTANAGTDQAITLPANSVTLNGSGSDADGTIISYSWTKISGPTQYTIGTASGATTTVSNLVQGTYQFELKVTDNSGDSGKDTVTITVNPAPVVVNKVPTAFAGIDQEITLPQSSVALTGTGTDSDGSIIAYSWKEIAGPGSYAFSASSQSNTLVNNLVEGVYDFELTVTDNSGAIGRDTVRVTVHPAPVVVVNQAPIANAGNDIEITLPVSYTTLKGSGFDKDGRIVSYQWTKLFGPKQFTLSTPDQSQTFVSNLDAGTYQFELKVTDDQGATGLDTMLVIVKPAQVNQAPTANAGENKVLYLPDNSLALTGTGSDPDGSIVSYQWNKISGPEQYKLSSNVSAQTTVSDLVKGVYQFQLVVKDNMGAIAMDTIQLDVKELATSTASVYPNPAVQTVNIDIKANTHQNVTQVRIADMLGRVVYQNTFMRNGTEMLKQIDVSKLSPGVYTIQIGTDINNVVTCKLIKK